MIAVTGIGIISALGKGADVTYEALLNKKSGIGCLHYLQTDHIDIPCAEVPMSDEEMKKLLNLSPELPLTRTSLMGMIAAKEALVSAKLHAFNGKRVAFINGTTVGGMEKSEEYYLDFLENDSHNVFIAEHDCGACTERIADYSGDFSFVTTLSTACSSAANAVILGANLIKNGLIDIALVGGSECITKFHLNGFRTLMILDPNPCRPFDETRAGLNLGEGAGYIVIESEASCKGRGVEPICTLAGYGNACDAFHQTASSKDGKGAFLAMQEALNMSGLQPSDIDYINAHGTGTTNNDASEGIAIARLFGDSIPCVSSTKSATGHTTSASGGIESVISILALQHQFIPANLNFKTPMPELPFSPSAECLTNRAMEHVLSNSFGFGGNNSTLIFSKL